MSRRRAEWSLVDEVLREPGAGAPWLRMTGACAALAVAMVAGSAAWAGLRSDALLPLLAGTAAIAALQRYPVMLTTSGAGQRCETHTELGMGVLLPGVSPAVLGLAVGVGHLQAALDRDLALWKRAFAVAQGVVAACVAGLVYDATASDGTDPALGAVAAGATFGIVMALLVAVVAALLRDGPMVRDTLRTLPRSILTSVGALSVGAVIGRALGAGDTWIGLAGLAGGIAFVRWSHVASTRADRMQALFSAALKLHETPRRADVADLLEQLAPTVVPGAHRLRITTEPPPDSDGVPVGDTGWLVADRSAGSNPPTAEDRQRLELLAGMLHDALRHADELSSAAAAAATDPLTGLLNRRGLESAIAVVDEPAAIAMVDLVGLKAINDTYSHAAGDAALQALGRALRSGVRAGDLVARIGGDEFIVVLVGQEAGPARAVLERVVARIADEHSLPPRLTISASLGVAAWVPDGTGTWADAIARADAELYARRAHDRLPSRDR